MELPGASVPPGAMLDAAHRALPPSVPPLLTVVALVIEPLTGACRR